MKKSFFCIALIILAVLASSVITSAQSTTKQNRQRWLTEMQGYKHEFITSELNLTEEQQTEFFPLYDEMNEEIERLNAKTRELEASVSQNEEASDLEIENAARTIFELKRAEGQIEMTYFEKFKGILTPRQLLQLKSSERKFTHQLMRHHRRMHTPDKE